jgi:hypothetical protein
LSRHEWQQSRQSPTRARRISLSPSDMGEEYILTPYKCFHSAARGALTWIAEQPKMPRS